MIARSTLLALSAVLASACAGTTPSQTRHHLRAQLQYRILLGNLHSQTNHSDGGQPPDRCEHAEKPQHGADGPAEAYAYADQRAHLDFLLTSEHNHMYDGQANGTNKSATPDAALGLFHAGLDAAEQYRRARPSFLALYGTEFGVIKNGGHINIINPDRLVTWEKNESGELLGDLFVDKFDYAGLYAAMKEHNYLGQFNHPAGSQFRVNDQPSAYTPEGDEVMVLCEVANASAFSSSLTEADNDLSEFGSHCDKLLLNGYHLAPASNQDNHCSNWGSSAKNRTGVLIPAGVPLSPSALWEALRARRVFATADKHSHIILRAGEHLMGERFQHQGPLELEVEHGSGSGAAIKRLDIVRGRVERSDHARGPRRVDGPEAAGGAVEVIGHEASMTVTPEAGTTFYYARILQEDGVKLWSAPVWVEVAPTDVR